MTAWRVMTWNILGAKDPDLGELAAVIREHEPDVLGVQEVRRGQARRLARRLGWRVVWTRKHYPYTPLLWWRAEGLAILSPWALSQRMRTTITPGVSTWIFKHRVLLAATITRRDASLRVFNTHLASHDATERVEQAKRVANRLRADPARDAKLLAELRPLEQRFLRRMIELKGTNDARLADFRWQLEELRVSLFAQELRTPQPVSVKRLDKVWAQLQG